MGWILFTAADLYIGIIVVKAMEPSVPPEKQRRLQIVLKILWAGLAITALALALKLLHRI